MRIRSTLHGAIFLVVIVVTVGLSLGRGVAQEHATPRATVALRAAQYLDVKAGTLRKNAIVLINGDRIAAIGSGVAIPDGATVIDLGRATILPGLIDCHTHLLLRLREGESYAEHLLTRSQADRALEGAASARQTLHAGFTTVRDVENEGSGYADIALRDAINDRLVDGPRMQVATRAIAAVGQYNPFGVSADLASFPTGAQMISGTEEARRAVREQIGHGADLIKVYADWQYPTLTPAELQVIVDEAHKLHHRVAAHATTREGIRNAVVAGVDSIEHGDDADRATLEMMKQKNTFLVSTAAIVFALRDSAKSDEQRAALSKDIELLRRTLSLAREVGVKIAGGIDASSSDLQGENARQLAALVQLGASPIEAIQSETLNAADLLGWSDRVGSLDVGKFADVIAVDGDPLADLAQLQRVTFVMKGGVVVQRRSPQS